MGRDKWKAKAKQEPQDRSFKPTYQKDPTRRDRDLSPAWSFAYVDHDGPFGWSCCQSRDDLKEVADRLRNFETMTWQQLREGGSHVVEVSACSPDAQKRLRDLRREDIDGLYSLRVTGRKRVIAVKLDHLLALLWWDPDHQVCPSAKKHT